VQIDAADCLPKGITIPGDGGKGLGQVLEGLGVLPERQEAPPPAEEPAPQPAPAPEPEKVIRDLLEGLIRR
jgi:hypothetical protein